MALERSAFLDVVEDSYSAYYNIIKRNLPEDLPIIFRGDFFKRDEKYWLMKSANLYSNEMNEFVYVFSADDFSMETVDACIQYALDEGLPRVKPHSEHQYTNIKVIFISDRFDADVLKAIEKRKFQKSYHFSLWGYSSLITTAVAVKDEKVWTNPAGRDMKKYFSKLFAAQHN